MHEYDKMVYHHMLDELAKLEARARIDPSASTVLADNIRKRALAIYQERDDEEFPYLEEYKKPGLSPEAWSKDELALAIAHLVKAAGWDAPKWKSLFRSEDYGRLYAYLFPRNIGDLSSPVPSNLVELARDCFAAIRARVE